MHCAAPAANCIRPPGESIPSSPQTMAQRYLTIKTRSEPIRADYVNAVLDKLVNWGFAADNLA